MNLGNIKDNWIYIQEPYVRVARVRLFHDWSEFMMANRGHFNINGIYALKMIAYGTSNSKCKAFGIDVLEKSGICNKYDVIAVYVARIKKAYPAYSGVYGEFDKVRQYLDDIPNLFVCGRNGVHRYNNMDHSMLSAFEVAKCILENKSDKSNIWHINSEESYHEAK